MEGYIDENRWVDLSSLPRRQFGDTFHIDWLKSSGHAVRFMYNGICGEINILQYNVNKRNLLIYIDGYSKLDGDVVCIDTLKSCALGRVLHKKIIDSAPELMMYLQDKNDAYIYSRKSNVRINTVCPLCGFKKTHIISNLYQFGFGCPQCSDGKSYAEKFMFNILKQLGVDFKNEVTKRDRGFEWIDGDYRYDFYFVVNNKKYFLELDGHFHKNEKFDTYEKVVEHDHIKDNLANDNGVDVIRIDCCYKKECDRFIYIKNNILSSRLNDIFNLNDVNFNVANEIALNSNICVASKLWNDGRTIGQIVDQIGVSRDTVLSYLKTASSIGWCKYDKTVSEERRVLAINNARCKPIALYDKDSNLVGVFHDSLELSSKSEKLYGTQFTRTNITSAARNGHRYCGYHIKYITHDEYEQFYNNTKLM